MTELQQILENSKLTAESINDNLIHPVMGTTDYKPREVFAELKEISDTYFTTKRTARMVGLAGLRGTGKSTLLWQTADYIYKNYTKNIYFFHLADLKNYDIGVREIYKGFEKYFTDGKLSSYKKPVVFLFDEVHEDPKWASDLKILYDLFRSVFVVATGSSALLLQSTADLVTRMYIQHVFPLSFTEFLNISNPEMKIEFRHSEELKYIFFGAKSAEELFLKLEDKQKLFADYFSQTNKLKDEIITYILYKNITRFAFIDSKLQTNKLIADLIRRVIYEDIPKMAENVNIHFSEKILQRIAASDEVNLQTLSQSIGISRKEINENLDILVKAELLNVLYPFGGIDTKINKTHKYFFMSPSVRRVLLNPFVISDNDNELYAKYLEDIVVLYLSRIFRYNNIVSFSSQKGQKNPDLIVETGGYPVLLEIGINKNTTKQITKSRIKYKYGIIINSKIEAPELHNDIVIIPLKYFLLL